jgi:asparaginyl-tRNA synthetase
MSRSTIQELLTQAEPNQIVTAQGWVRTRRGNKAVSFIALNDGSTINNLQIVVDYAKIDEETIKSIGTGACLKVVGLLVESPAAGQRVEMQAHEILIYGTADDTFPMQKKGHTLEFLREQAHLRFRTNTFGAIFRVRHALAFGIHKFFNDNGYVYLHSPIITASDAEGAGAMFRVTTLDQKNIPIVDGEPDYSQDFFGQGTHLTVSGQLEAELAAMALGKVYTFGPTFRAEQSNTSRHLAEFWMIEPEVAFNDLEDNMNLAEAFLKYLVQYALDRCADDLDFLNKQYDNTLLERLRFVLANDFKRLTYTEAVEILVNCGEKFEFAVDWGTDLQSEHERYLVEKHFGRPVILTNYPKDIKAFYMRLNEDGKTVRAMDVLFPGIGEIIGGSQREERYDELVARMKAMDVSTDELWWYLDTRKFGTAPHAGFGLGFERLILFVTGMTNIRDVIPFPRFPQNAQF